MTTNIPALQNHPQTRVNTYAPQSHPQIAHQTNLRYPKYPPLPTLPSRRYTAEEVASLRPSVLPSYVGSQMSSKLYNLLISLQSTGGYSHTYGALDPVQVIQMAPHLTSIYISGWQCSSTASTTNEPGPDFADYPMNTVPNKCDQLFRAQAHHDKRQVRNVVVPRRIRGGEARRATLTHQLTLARHPRFARLSTKSAPRPSWTASPSPAPQ